MFGQAVLSSTTTLLETPQGGTSATTLRAVQIRTAGGSIGESSTDQPARSFVESVAWHVCERIQLGCRTQSRGTSCVLREFPADPPPSALASLGLLSYHFEHRNPPMSPANLKGLSMRSSFAIVASPLFRYSPLRQLPRKIGRDFADPMEQALATPRPFQ